MNDDQARRRLDALALECYSDDSDPGMQETEANIHEMVLLYAEAKVACSIVTAIGRQPLSQEDIDAEIARDPAGYTAEFKRHVDEWYEQASERLDAEIERTEQLN
jgi:hypothetical protein